MATPLSVFRRGSVPAITAWWTGAGGTVGLFLLLLPGLSGYLPPLVLAVMGAFIGLLVGLSNVVEQRDQYKERLDEREKWREIAHRLGELGIEGKALIPKPYTTVEPWEDVHAWRDKVATYIEGHLGKSYRFLFESGAGNHPKVPKKITDEDAQERWIHIQARLMTLKKIIWKAASIADRPFV